MKRDDLQRNFERAFDESLELTYEIWPLVNGHSRAAIEMSLITMLSRVVAFYPEKHRAEVLRGICRTLERAVPVAAEHLRAMQAQMHGGGHS